MFDCREYIGSSSRNISRRWKEHLSDLRAGRHANRLLQTAWNAYGELFFSFRILELCPPDQCLDREQWWIDHAHPKYNISKIAGSPMTGRTLSPEHRAKIGASQIGRHHTPETLIKMSVAATGRKLSFAIKDKIRLSKTGRKNPHLGCKWTPERRALQRAINLGLKHTPASIVLMSIARKLWWKNHRLQSQSNPAL